MNDYFSKLNSGERRFVVVVGLVLFLVVNLIWVRPHFSDWGNLKARLSRAENTLNNYTKVVNQKPQYERLVKEIQSESATSIPPEDQATDLIRTIHRHGQQHGVLLGNFSQASTKSDQFFVEKAQPVSLTADEKQLVDFLYYLGAGDSLIRVRGLSIRPDSTRQKLTVTVTLVASYQKKETGPAPVGRGRRGRSAAKAP